MGAAESLEKPTVPMVGVSMLSERGTAVLSGYGEMLKHALLDTPDHWHQLLRLNLETEAGMQALMPFIERSRAVKERIVAADPREHGLCRALNFGHTIGHALEAQMLANGKPAPHGYCVIWGMVAALYLSIIRCGFPRTVLHQLEQVMLRYYGRPVCNCQDQSQLIALILQDKKTPQRAYDLPCCGVLVNLSPTRSSLRKRRRRRCLTCYRCKPSLFLYTMLPTRVAAP